jgi:hypothetical protein
MLKIVPRAAWGALKPDHRAPNERGFYNASTNPGGWRVYDEPLAEVLTTLVVHHSALLVSQGALEIQRLHMGERGFADIGYHFVIDGRGRVYEGRRVNVRGVHTGGHNTGAVGVVLLGNFEVIDPTRAQWASLAALARTLAEQYAGLAYLAGHRYFQPGETLCPGQNVAPLLREFAAEVGLTYGSG